ncbi:DUF4357 domain-containing protein [Niabella hibiscisoli]|uniref:DUF4357 domain-containing protein n=1 Tax=Niabella hibiscisoli TaxID=1825928 RepID=UPI001F0ED034|nr:hypothetical protein [Niabella hibiscisoli]MCH5716683.1 hypothetical protein [Niabella hibiscisoli]
MSDESFAKTNVTIKMLLESKVLRSGTEIFCPNSTVKGFINHDGSVSVIIGNQEKNFESLSGAAKYIEGRSINGWIYWRTNTENGQVALSDFRDAYLNL